MLISYTPNNLHTELSKIVFKNYSNNLEATFYSIIFSQAPEDKKDCMEISEHIKTKDNLTENIFNSLFYTFLKEFQKKFTQEFEVFNLYEPFEIECEIDCKKCNVKPHNLRKNYKAPCISESAKDIPELQLRKTPDKREYNKTGIEYIHEVKKRGHLYWLISFKNMSGAFTTKTIAQKLTTIDKMVRLRDELIEVKGLWKFREKV